MKRLLIIPVLLLLAGCTTEAAQPDPLIMQHAQEIKDLKQDIGTLTQRLYETESSLLEVWVKHNSLFLSSQALHVDSYCGSTDGYRDEASRIKLQYPSNYKNDPIRVDGSVNFLNNIHKEAC